jgi:hypothetical protein
MRALNGSIEGEYDSSRQVTEGANSQENKYLSV